MEEKWFTTSDGVKIYYQIYPNEKKNKTLVLLHGLGGDLDAWKKDVDIFRKLGYPVVLVDLRGHGKSDRPTTDQSYHFKRFAEDIKEIILVEELKRTILVGHCFGGVIAMMVDVYFPSIINALVLIDTTYKPHFLAESFSKHKSLQKLMDLVIKVSPTIHSSSPRDYAIFVGTKDIDIRRLWSDITHTSLKTYLLASELLVNMPPESFLRKIQVPTLIIEGIEDTIFPVELAAVMYQRIKHSAVEFIEEANHILVLNNPTEITATIDRFVENLKKA